MNAAANTMQLATLLGDFVDDTARLATADMTVSVSGVCLDSRLLAFGDVYLAMAGASAHGLQFIDAALANGACAVVVDDAGISAHADAIDKVRAAGKPVLHIAQLKQRAGEIAARFYQDPSQQLQVVAVTGTDGKTSVCRFVADALNGAGHCCGYIGTLGWGIGVLTETQLTTPDAVSIQRMLAELRDEGARVVALEASSHGLQEGRLDAVNIDVAVLTNFGRDHLDYHSSLSEYKKAKARLFDWPGIRFVVVNGQDEFGSEIAIKVSGRADCSSVVFIADDAMSQSTGVDADILIQTDSVKLRSNGLQFGLIDNGERFEQHSNLMGSFNVDNLLACHGVLRALGQAANDASANLNYVEQVPGRIEQFSAENKPTAIVDYAHTPQALAAVIEAVRHHCFGMLWVVFGCGGDRDPGKRAPMGLAAEQADHIIVTDDNPRTELSEDILQQIVAGMRNPARAVVIADRAAAIAHALNHAASNDLVLIAGKGHEDYQIVGTQKLEFSDRACVEQFMQEAV